MQAVRCGVHPGEQSRVVSRGQLQPPGRGTDGTRLGGVAEPRCRGWPERNVRPEVGSAMGVGERKGHIWIVGKH